MKIAVLGTGEVGRALAPALLNLHHAVSVGTRDPEETFHSNETFRELLNQYPGIRLASFAEALRGADIVVNALYGPACVEILSQLSAALDSRIIIDISSPFNGRIEGAILNPVNTDSLGEQVQRALPNVRVVKTLNTMAAVVMTEPGIVGTADHSVFLSGNSADAKETVTELLYSLGWSDIVDLGPISTSRASEMLLRMWIDLYKALGTDLFGFRVVRPAKSDPHTLSVP
ncbi:NADPH-dependent F420 reductase [Streptomyces sp. NPDC002952]|uniref:NADPH-dependent F420 reductase n=1 Tax=Streptomyces sp. NPDC002952 TaxID=3364673 RepID=UPI0036BC1595